MFTELEKKILDATEPQYNYITRDVNGYLYLSTNKPSFYKGHLSATKGLACFRAFDSLFKDVKICDDPICFRPTVLDGAEKEYLKTVFKPFANKIVYVVKQTRIIPEKRHFIRAYLKHGDIMTFPDFKSGTMYKGMEPYRKYTLAELGITYDN